MEVAKLKVRELVIATKNPGKIHELEQMLAGTGIAVAPLGACGDIPEPIEDGTTFMANALLKAEYYCRATGKPCLADDSGLEVDALGGAPGVLSARYAGEGATPEQRNAKLLDALSAVHGVQRTARFCCAAVVMNTDGSYIAAEGSCEGVIMDAPSGHGGFGYDPLFFALDAGRGMAELSAEAKNAISHRGRALRALLAKMGILHAF